MKDLFIIGVGGFGREVAWMVERINAVEATGNSKDSLMTMSCYMIQVWMVTQLLTELII